MPFKLIQFLALVVTALALIPGGAHLFALPGKIGMDEAAYFTVQQIYRGWSLFGIALIAALLLNLLAAWLLRRQGTAAVLSLLAALLLAATLVIFFLWTYPANQATANWTSVPPDWQALRLRWEYSHAVNAGLTFVALCCAALSALTLRR